VTEAKLIASLSRAKVKMVLTPRAKSLAFTRLEGKGESLFCSDL
jgi:hypothetical protein